MDADALDSDLVARLDPHSPEVTPLQPAAACGSEDVTLRARRQFAGQVSVDGDGSHRLGCLAVVALALLPADFGDGAADLDAPLAAVLHDVVRPERDALAPPQPGADQRADQQLVAGLDGGQHAPVLGWRQNRHLPGPAVGDLDALRRVLGKHTVLHRRPAQFPEHGHDVADGRTGHLAPQVSGEGADPKRVEVVQRHGAETGVDVLEHVGVALAACLLQPVASEPAGPVSLGGDLAALAGGGDDLGAVDDELGVLAA
jgi:hypothetical protein